MDELKTEILSILGAAAGGTILYGDLYNSVQGRNVSRLPLALKELKAEGKITKKIAYLPESGGFENRVTLLGGE